VLAGLISSRKSNGNSGLPILSRIPGVRDATGTNNKTANRNELIVLIRPQIVRNGEDAQSVAEDLRTRMWAIGNRERQSP
jgi:general secretion pathway protein D